MHFTHLKHFTTFLFVFICYGSLRFSFLTCDAISLNTSEDIKHIFNGNHSINDINVSHTEGIPKSGNFAEGGLLNVNLSAVVAKKNYTLTGVTNASKNASGNLGKSLEESDNNNYKNISSTKTLSPTKLNDTGSNLFLGVPEVIHINGTSSIKPRKGVYFNKIVPRKGVENDKGGDDNSNFLLCVWLGENDCYNFSILNDDYCKCCKKGNALGKSLKHNYSVNCENCKPVINDFSVEKHICENICCYDKFHKTGSVSNTQDTIYKNKTMTPRTKFEKGNVSITEKMESDPNKEFGNFVKSSKHKPNVTKVPYDIESVTEVSSKTKQKVFIPIIVSLLLLPLVAILVFVMLHKIKEIWDKRYYKRMDFLIDGMYQD